MVCSLLSVCSLNLTSSDPGTGKIWGTAPVNTVDDVDSAVQAAHAAFLKYRKVNPRVRAQLLLKWDALIREHKEDLALILTHETGKPLSESRAEIDYSAGFTWWFAGEAERIRGTVAQPSQDGRRVFTVKQPIGVAVALVPWNFPIAMILRKAGAAFAAGCPMIIKPSPETPYTVLTLAYLAEKAGFAPGVMNVLTTDLENTPSLSEALCRHDLVKKVTFTGSTRIGKLVAKICADGLKKVTLELGGNCPVLIFADADLDAAMEAIFALKWRHAGQACITANRIYVQKPVYEKFTDMMVQKATALKIGHGAQDGTTLGPVTTKRSLDKAESLVEDAKQKGARILSGGKRIENGGGYFFNPTVIADANEDMLVAQEEQFAPIAALFSFETESEVVEKANSTSVRIPPLFGVY
jgi:succinate-semialdehyde dehydrogenase/glutarate-semialdehyde dehydrogenase